MQALIIENDKIVIKLSCDGTQITKSNVYLLNFTFTIINFKTTCKTSQGNFILGKFLSFYYLFFLNLLYLYEGMFQIESECNSELKGALKELFKELKEIKFIEINGVNYQIEFKLGGDMKCLALLLGINAANAKFSCCWCHCNLKETVDLSAEWPISRSQALANIQYLANSNGYKYEHLINFIDFDNVVIDMLHLLLRITDRLYELILEKLTLFDKNDSIDI